MIAFQSLQLIAFMMQVCHTLLLCVDWFIDLDLIRLLRTSEMLRFVPVCTYESFKFNPHRIVNLGRLFAFSDFSRIDPISDCLRMEMFDVSAESDLGI